MLPQQTNLWPTRNDCSCGGNSRLRAVCFAGLTRFLWLQQLSAPRLKSNDCFALAFSKRLALLVRLFEWEDGSTQQVLAGWRWARPLHGVVGKHAP